MKLLKTGIFLIILLAFHLIGKAQNPSYYKLGEEELSGIDIYDVVQDNEHNYWLATNNGMIKYDGYTYKKITHEGALSNSVFNLQLDYENNVFCLNLSGQIFRIKNDSSEIYFQIPDSLMSPDIRYSFDNHNNMIISTNAVFRVIQRKMEYIGSSRYRTYSSEILQLVDSSLIFHNLSSNQLVNLKNGKIKTENLNTTTQPFIIQFFYLNHQLHYYDKRSGNLLSRKGPDFLIDTSFSPIRKNNEILRFYSDNENLWVAKQSGGMLVFDKQLNPLFNSQTLFENILISSFFKDHEGNIILGTFGEGLIIISNLNLVDVHLSDPNTKITRITSASNNSIFLGSQDGRVYQVDANQKFSLLWDNRSKNIEILEYFESTNELLFDGKETTLLHINSKKISMQDWGAVKDITPISNGNYFIATNHGIYQYNSVKKITTIIDTKGLNLRTNSVGYDKKNKLIYAGTALGLKIGDIKNVRSFKLNNSSLICTDILYFNERIYIATSRNGILIFENQQLIQNWTKKNELISNSIKHLKAYQGKIYLSTTKGMQVLNEKGESLFILNKSNGLHTNSIIDFEIRNDVLWLVHQKGVQQIDLRQLEPFKYLPTISISKTLVNDSIFYFSENTSLTYDQNKLEFTISSSSIKYQSEIKYHYQLEGLDNDWQINEYTNNHLTYKSLPPGDYVFKIKAVCRKNESKILIIPFTITKPFWNTWWFYIINALVFISVTIYIFQLQIKKQKRKIKLENELNASKLIAIQSQMNPHFIFNAINSIQDLILKGDIDNSYNYIIKFSKLVRQTLNFSDKEFIDIEDEIDLLNIYLELEKLRFKDDFTYSINLNDIEDIQVPPMLIQPFVENAIKHGLLHKEGIKKLDITFKKDKTLHCIVTDNGIGRKKAQEIKARQQKNHQSFSVNATRTRFEIMQSHYQQDLGVQFENLTNKTENTGTKAIINMPFRQNY